MSKCISKEGKSLVVDLKKKTKNEYIWKKNQEGYNKNWH